MSSIKRKLRRDVPNDSEVVESDVRERILEALEEPKVQHSKDLAKKANCAPSTLYKHLDRLHREGLVISEKIGREVKYALPKNRAELISSVSTKSELEDYVIKKAFALLDEIYRASTDKNEIKEIIFRCALLHDTVERLRETHSGLPDFGTEAFESPSALKTFIESKGRYKLLYWNKYLIGVLQALGVGPPKQLGEPVDKNLKEKRSEL